MVPSNVVGKHDYSRVMILASLVIATLVGVAALLVGAERLYAKERQQQHVSGAVPLQVDNLENSAPLFSGAGLYPITRRNVPITLNQVITLPILDEPDTLPGSLGWLTWDGQNTILALCGSLTPPGNSSIYYNPGTPANNWTPNYTDHIIAVSKWVQGAPGNKNSTCVRNLLDWHIANQDEMAIPLYDQVASAGVYSNYRVAGFAAFKLLSYDLSVSPYLVLKFVWVTAGDYAQTITMSKAVTPTVAAAGTPVSYTLFITSQSPAAVNSLVMSDVLPVELTFISGTLYADAGSATCSGGVISWTGALSPAQRANITFEALVNVGVPPTSLVTNTATLWGDGARNGLGAVAVFTVCQPVTGAGFVWHPMTPTVGAQVTFTGTATGLQPIAFAWDWGDDTTSAGAAITHTYEASGTFRVVMTATNGCGWQVVTHTVTVESAILPCEPIKVIALASNEPVQLGQPIYLSATVTGDEPITYTWNYGGGGDGSGLDTATPVFTYTQAGTYTIWLTAENACPSTDVYTIAVHVNLVGPEQYIYLPVVMRQ